MKCEVTKVSTLEEELANIGQLPQPVGIILFGADCDFKNEVVEKILIEFHGQLAWGSYAKVTIGQAKDMLNTSRRFMVVLDSNESTNHSLRHQCVLNLRSLGAKTVVGFYVRARQKEYGPLTPDAEIEKNRTHNMIIREIDNSHPTADGLDCFIVVEEKEG